MRELQEQYLAQAERVRKARVEYSKAWQMARLKSNSDRQAEQMAIEMTSDVLTTEYAKLEVIKKEMLDDTESPAYPY